MSNLHNAAVLLMSLPQDQAGDLMERLNPREVEQVSTEIARLERVTSDEQEEVIRLFAETNPAAGGGAGGIGAPTPSATSAAGSHGSGGWRP